MNDTELIKSRLDIADIVQEYVQLKPAGANMKGLCPFHDEKTPSFMVHRGKQIFHCFGCNTGGDIFTFLQKIENIEFREALKLLATKAGIPLQSYNPEKEHIKNRLKDLLETAAQWYHHQLYTPAGKRALEYLTKQRKLTSETLELFRIGYVPAGWEHIGPFLRSKGFRDNEIAQSGLVIQKEGSARYYDRFRERIMFPLCDIHGMVIGFTGRLLPEDEQKERAGGKYINTPETILYHKAQVLFGLNHAKHAIKEHDAVVFVEGQMDVLACHQAGTQHVVAVSGTALTEEQLRTLKRFTHTIIFALDQDAAGEEALKRAVITAWTEELSPYVVALPQTAKDPAELIQHDQVLWHHALSNRQPFMDYYIHRLSQRYSPTTPEGKKAFAKKVLPLIKTIVDPIEQAHYINMVSESLGVARAYIQEALARIPHSLPTRPTPDTLQQEPLPQKKYTTLEYIMALLFTHPSIASALAEQLSPQDIPQNEYKTLYTTWYEWYTQTTQSNEISFSHTSLNDVLTQQCSVLELLGEKEYATLTHEQAVRELERLIVNYKRHAITTELIHIEQQLKQSEEHSHTNTSEQLMRRFRELTQKLT